MGVTAVIHPKQHRPYPHPNPPHKGEGFALSYFFFASGCFVSTSVFNLPSATCV